MMAPYAIGHLKIGFIFDELGYKMADDERFKLYLTNTLEMEEIKQIAIPGISLLSEESHLAGKVKKEQPMLVILGNPPYSNINEWTEWLLKEDIDVIIKWMASRWARKIRKGYRMIMSNSCALPNGRYRLLVTASWV